MVQLVTCTTRSLSNSPEFESRRKYIRTHFVQLCTNTKKCNIVPALLPDPPRVLELEGGGSYFESTVSITNKNVTTKKSSHTTDTPKSQINT